MSKGKRAALGFAVLLAALLSALLADAIFLLATDQ